MTTIYSLLMWIIAGDYQTIMDVASIPSSVQASGEFLGKSDHWLAQALKLDKGKKSVQLPLENAIHWRTAEQHLGKDLPSAI